MIWERIFNFLKKNGGKWFTANEIANKLKISTDYVTERLNKLKNKSSIFFRLNKNKDNSFEFMYKK